MRRLRAKGGITHQSARLTSGKLTRLVTIWETIKRVNDTRAQEKQCFSLILILILVLVLLNHFVSFFGHFLLNILFSSCLFKLTDKLIVRFLPDLDRLFRYFRRQFDPLVVFTILDIFVKLVQGLLELDEECFQVVEHAQNFVVVSNPIFLVLVKVACLVLIPHYCYKRKKCISRLRHSGKIKDVLNKLTYCPWFDPRSVFFSTLLVTKGKDHFWRISTGRLRRHHWLLRCTKEGSLSRDRQLLCGYSFLLLLHFLRIFSWLLSSLWSSTWFPWVSSWPHCCSILPLRSPFSESW